MNVNGGKLHCSECGSGFVEIDPMDDGRGIVVSCGWCDHQARYIKTADVAMIDASSCRGERCSCVKGAA